MLQTVRAVAYTIHGFYDVTVLLWAPSTFLRLAMVLCALPHRHTVFSTPEAYKTDVESSPDVTCSPTAAKRSAQNIKFAL